jgi:hypothetical protein
MCPFRTIKTGIPAPVDRKDQCPDSRADEMILLFLKMLVMPDLFFLY